MKKKLILLLLTLTLCSFNLTKVKAETINWKAIRLYKAEKKVYRKYTKTDGTVVKRGNIAYIYMGNNTIYCIEMGKDIYSDLGAGKATFTNKGELGKYFTKNLDKKVKIGKQEINIVDAVGLISKYGTQLYGDGSTTDKNKYYLAAQVLIWQYLSEAGVYGDSIKGDIEIFYLNNGKEKTIDLSTEKKKIIEEINRYFKKPNIQGNIIATTNEEGTKHQFTLTDENKVLKNYEMTVNTEGIDCNKTDNKITCSYPIPEPGTGTTPTSVKFSFEKKGTGSNNKVFKSGDKYQATLLMDKTPTVSSSKTVNLGVKKYRLAILKNDSDDDSKVLEGVTYQICSDENCANVIGEPETTTEEGIVTFNDLEENVDYYVKEVETIEGYVLDKATKKVTINTKDTTKYNADTLTYTVGYTNTKEKINGYIQINKTDKEDNKPLEGITFDVYDENDEVIETIKTDKDGKAKTKLLPKGLYYVKEKEPLKDYLLIEEEQVVKIEENNKTYELSFVNEKVAPTGDTNILLLITIAACTLICAIIIYIKKINLVKNNTI